MPFDIEAFLRFKPARYSCLKCLALWENPITGCDLDKERRTAKCRVCGVKYITTDKYSIYRIYEYLRASEPRQPLHRVENLVSHGTSLAHVSAEFKQRRKEHPPLRSLMQAFLKARSFIHFVSTGVSREMIGALKLAAQYVPIQGIVSGNIGENIISEVTNYKDEAPDLSIHFWKHGEFRSVDEPHQKLIVIDGLLAFKGSSNLSYTAWRSSVNNMDIIEIVSDIDEVISLHNRYFSPLWALLSDRGDEILMEDDDVPF